MKQWLIDDPVSGSAECTVVCQDEFHKWDDPEKIHVVAYESYDKLRTERDELKMLINSVELREHIENATKALRREARLVEALHLICGKGMNPAGVAFGAMYIASQALAENAELFKENR